IGEAANGTDMPGQRSKLLTRAQVPMVNLLVATPQHQRPPIRRKSQAMSSAIRNRGLPTDLACKQLPQTDRSRLALGSLRCSGRSQRLAVWRECERPNGLLRAWQALQDLSGGDFPQQDRTVLAGMSQELAIR